MTEPIWNQFLTERDKAVFATAGYGARQGFGKRPALLIIDVNMGSAAISRSRSSNRSRSGAIPAARMPGWRCPTSAP